jgi:hypothetical protein
MAGIKTINALIHRLRRGIKAGNEWGGGVGEGHAGRVGLGRQSPVEVARGGRRRRRAE